MRIKHVLPTLLIAGLLFINLPAWGGGWSSSGSPSRSPVQIPQFPVDLPGYHCQIAVSVPETTDILTYSETLEAKDFVNGYATIVTPAFERYANTAGQKLRFHGSLPGANPERLYLDLFARAGTKRDASLVTAHVSKDEAAATNFISLEVGLELARKGSEKKDRVTVSATCLR